jgi:hypothetical protein
VASTGGFNAAFVLKAIFLNRDSSRLRCSSSPVASTAEASGSPDAAAALASLAFRALSTAAFFIAIFRNCCSVNPQGFESFSSELFDPLLSVTDGSVLPRETPLPDFGPIDVDAQGDEIDLFCAAIHRNQNVLAAEDVLAAEESFLKLYGCGDRSTR